MAPTKNLNLLLFHLLQELAAKVIVLQYNMKCPVPITLVESPRMKRAPRSALINEPNPMVKRTRPAWPKKKVAIMMGYCGTGYQGMQLYQRKALLILNFFLWHRNPNVRTIEAELFNALCKEGLVSDDNAIDPKKIGWMRSCRTDKGVHAAGQVVSLKMLLKPSEEGSESKTGHEDESLFGDITKRLNSLLPSQIRIYGIKRTVNSFHAKERTDSRFYEYLLPTYVLQPISPDIYAKKSQSEESKPPEQEDLKIAFDDVADDEAIVDACPDDGSSPDEDGKKVLTEEIQELKQFRLTLEVHRKLCEMLQRYKGTHTFHNFTIGMTMSNPSCRRHIFETTLSEPFIKNGFEWISVVFHGQSFMLHQIRKMVGLVVMSIRLGVGPEIIDRCFKEAKVNIPRAPALGLLLDKAVFSGYNKVNPEKDAIDFDLFNAERSTLKNELVYPKIFGEEEETHQ